MAGANSCQSGRDFISHRQPDGRAEILWRALVIALGATAGITLANDEAPMLDAIVIRRTTEGRLVDDVDPRANSLLIVITNVTNAEVRMSGDIEAIIVSSEDGLFQGHYDYGIDAPRRFRALQPGQVLVVEDMRVRDVQWEAMRQGDVHLVVRCEGRDGGTAVRARVFDEALSLK